MMGLAEALEARFRAPAWALFHEVANGTGWDWNRHADAIAMGIWPSRGLEIHGMEFKASRADWLRELKDPKKAEDMIGYCDYWWLVTTKDDIAHADEIPTEWGHMHLKGSRLVTVKAAPKREGAKLDKGFVAAVVRKAYAIATSDKLIQGKIRAAFEDGKKSSCEHDGVELRIARDEANRAKEAVERFNKASGLEIDKYNAGRIGEAVHAFMRLDQADYKGQMAEMARRFAAISRNIEAHLANLDAKVPAC
jgi:hypothetical protein